MNSVRSSLRNSLETTYGQQSVLLSCDRTNLTETDHSRHPQDFGSFLVDHNPCNYSRMSAQFSRNLSTRNMSSRCTSSQNVSRAVESHLENEALKDLHSLSIEQQRCPSPDYHAMNLGDINFEQSILVEHNETKMSRLDRNERSAYQMSKQDESIAQNHSVMSIVAERPKENEIGDMSGNMADLQIEDQYPDLVDADMFDETFDTSGASQKVPMSKNQTKSTEEDKAEADDLMTGEDFDETFDPTEQENRGESGETIAAEAFNETFDPSESTEKVMKPPPVCSEKETTKSEDLVPADAFDETFSPVDISQEVLALPKPPTKNSESKSSEHDNAVDLGAFDETFDPGDLTQEILVLPKPQGKTSENKSTVSGNALDAGAFDETFLPDELTQEILALPKPSRKNNENKSTESGNALDAGAFDETFDPDDLTQEILAKPKSPTKINENKSKESGSTVDAGAFDETFDPDDITQEILAKPKPPIETSKNKSTEPGNAVDPGAFDETFDPNEFTEVMLPPKSQTDCNPKEVTESYPRVNEHSEGPFQSEPVDNDPPYSEYDDYLESDESSCYLEDFQKAMAKASQYPAPCVQRKQINDPVPNKDMAAEADLSDSGSDTDSMLLLACDGNQGENLILMSDRVGQPNTELPLQDKGNQEREGDFQVDNQAVGMIPSRPVVPQSPIVVHSDNNMENSKSKLKGSESAPNLSISQSSCDSQNTVIDMHPNESNSSEVPVHTSNHSHSSNVSKISKGNDKSIKDSFACPVEEMPFSEDLDAFLQEMSYSQGGHLEEPLQPAKDTDWASSTIHEGTNENRTKSPKCKAIEGSTSSAENTAGKENHPKNCPGTYLKAKGESQSEDPSAQKEEMVSDNASYMALENGSEDMFCSPEPNEGYSNRMSKSETRLEAGSEMDSQSMNLFSSCSELFSDSSVNQDSKTNHHSRRGDSKDDSVFINESEARSSKSVFVKGANVRSKTLSSVYSLGGVSSIRGSETNASHRVFNSTSLGENMSENRNKSRASSSHDTRSSARPVQIINDSNDEASDDPGMNNKNVHFAGRLAEAKSIHHIDFKMKVTPILKRKPKRKSILKSGVSFVPNFVSPLHSPSTTSPGVMSSQVDLFSPSPEVLTKQQKSKKLNSTYHSTPVLRINRKPFKKALQENSFDSVVQSTDESGEIIPASGKKSNPRGRFRFSGKAVTKPKVSNKIASKSMPKNSSEKENFPRALVKKQETGQVSRQATTKRNEDQNCDDLDGSIIEPSQPQSKKCFHFKSTADKKQETMSESRGSASNYSADLFGGDSNDLFSDNSWEENVDVDLCKQLF